MIVIVKQVARRQGAESIVADVTLELEGNEKVPGSRGSFTISSLPDEEVAGLNPGDRVEIILGKQGK